MEFLDRLEKGVCVGKIVFNKHLEEVIDPHRLKSKLFATVAVVFFKKNLGRWVIRESK